MSVSKEENTKDGRTVKVTQMELDSKEAMDLLVKQINELKRKVQLLSTMQMTIVDYLGNKSTDFRAQAIANVMAQKVFRDDFTDFLNNSKDVPDEVKLKNMEINEEIAKIEKELNLNLNNEEE